MIHSIRHWFSCQIYFNVNYMDKQNFVVCFWMMFLQYLEGFCQKTKYQQTLDIMSISVFKKPEISSKFRPKSDGFIA